MAVTARLLVAAGTFVSPLTRVAPEGFEDIDAEFSDEIRALVQEKERSPTVRFARSQFAGELRGESHKLTEDPECRFVLATNVTLGGGLTATGWDRSLSDCVVQNDPDELAGQLAGAFEDPYEILGRCHIVQVGWDVVEKSRADLARILDIHPSVAALTYSRPLELITEATMRQRSATPDTAQWIAVSDVDSLANRVLESVDVDSLDEAVRQGIIEPVDFSVRADLTMEEFLAGVDVLPTHIGGDLDLPRPTEVTALIEGLGERDSALVVGASGAGKSALLWRVARELAGQVRPYRLLRLSPEDIPSLSRWIRLQEPSANCPLLICADNLGRSGNEGWTALATEFVDNPGVLLLGACREEDFRPDLAVGRTTIVDPHLDRELAESISEMLVSRDVTTTLDVSEAFNASEGLLMEFLSLLMTGRRVKQVIEQQVADRLNEERATERDILRLVATAHSVGVAVPAEALETMLPGRDLTPALAVLDREHILVSDDGNQWRELHELRSTVARDYLHRFPPPAMAATIRRLVEHHPIADAVRIIELYARSEVDLEPVAEAVSDILGAGRINAEDGARLMGALGMADAYRRARMCLRAIEDNRPSRLDPETVLNLAYSHRFAGVNIDTLKDINPGFRHLVQVAELLPDPQSLREIGLQALSSDEVVGIAFRGTPDQAVAWLESLEGTAAAATINGHDIAERLGDAPLAVVASLSATLRTLSGVEGTAFYPDVFGDFDHRMRRLVTGLPDCVGISFEDTSDGRVVTVTLLAPGDDSTLNDRSVQTFRLVFDLLPEVDIAETIVVTPDGDRLAVSDHEAGYKRISRENLPRPRQVADNANFLRAGRLLLSSRYWTEPIRLLANAAEQLLDLRNEVVSWLINWHHNRRKRAVAAQCLDSLMVELAGGPKVPVSDEDTGDRNNAMKAMEEAVAVVRDIATTEWPDASASRSLGGRCRNVVDRLMEPRQDNLPSLSTVGDPVPEALVEMLSLLAEMLIARAEQRSIAPDISRRAGSESWVDVSRRCMDAVASAGYQAEREALEDALGTYASSCAIHRVEHADLNSAQFLTDKWVLVVSPDGDLPDVLSLLDRLGPAMALQLASRTFVAFGVTDDVILPAYAFKMGASNWWPASGDELLEIASGIGTKVAASTQLQTWDAFVNELVEASRAAALFRLRHEAGLDVDRAAFESRLASARSAAELCHPMLQAEGKRLLDRVENEPDGQGESLVGEVYRSLTHEELGADVSAIMNCRLGALSIDLSGVSPDGWIW